MHELNVSLAVIGGIVLLLGMFSAWMKRTSFMAQPLTRWYSRVDRSDEAGRDA